MVADQEGIIFILHLQGSPIGKTQVEVGVGRQRSPADSIQPERPEYRIGGAGEEGIWRGRREYLAHIQGCIGAS
jgi:hypothetical protein